MLGDLLICLLHKHALGSGLGPGTELGVVYGQLCPKDPATCRLAAGDRCAELATISSSECVLVLLTCLLELWWQPRELGKHGPILLRREVRFAEVIQQSMDEQPRSVP